MNTKLFVATFLFSITLMAAPKNKTSNTLKNTTMQTDSLLRHVVMFKFIADAPAEKVKEIEDAFSELPLKIKEIKGYEWGTNNSPEGLNKGLTHCFFVTFASEKDRAIYLPHPEHLAFVEILKPYLDDVVVIDYWTK